MCLPEFHLFLCPLFTARTVGGEAGGDNPDFAEAMIEHDQAVVKADVAVGQFEIVDGTAREFRLGEIFQVVAPVTEAAAERKRQINFVQQFEARHQTVEQMPRVAELESGAGVWRLRASGAWRFRSASQRNET